MDRIDAMRLFCRIVERRSFSLAASDLGLPRSTVTEALRQLETRLGVRLLQRTTRHVAPTLDGEAFYRRCLAIVADVEEAEGAFGAGTARGLLRVDVPGTLARHVLMPDLPEFLARNPDLRLHIGEGHRFVDLVREGVDCVLRVGHLEDSTMIARQVAMLDEVTYASPAYLARHGTPRTPEDLAGHRMIGYLAPTGGDPIPFEFTVNGARRSFTLPAVVTVATAETSLVLARQGLGLVQAPRYHAAADLAAGRLVEVLADFAPPPSPVSLLYPPSRQLSPRLRVFADWVVARFAARLPSARGGCQAGPVPLQDGA